jgi:hypothetical protein
MTAAPKASSSIPAEYSSARCHRFARMRWPVCSGGFSCTVCLPRGSELFPRERWGARGAPPGRGFPHALRVLWDVRRLLPVYTGLRQVPVEERGDVLCVHAVEVKMKPARRFTLARGG